MEAGPDAPLWRHAGLVDRPIAAPVAQHDPLAPDALGQVLVGRADEHLLDPGRSSPQRAAAVARASSASNSTIGQTTSPSASMARSASGNWASNSTGTPASVL